MISRYLMITLLLFPVILMCQENSSEEELIINTVENYYYGYVERDIDRLTAAFDIENGTMKIPTKTDDGKESVTNNYFKDVIPRWAAREQLSQEMKEACSLEILSVDLVDVKIGTSKIRMQIGETVFIDILSLQKINKEWKITNKIYLVK